MARSCFTLTLIAALHLQPGCSDDSHPSASPENQSSEISTVASAKPRATDVQISTSDTETLVDGNTEFALRLYDSVRASSNDNFFYSPYSISLALAMTYAGARGDTEQQMSQALGFSLTQENLHPAFNALDQFLANRGQRIEEGEEGSPFTLNIANSIWGQHGFEFLEEFLDVLAENYGAGMHMVDFADPENARGSSTTRLPIKPRAVSRI